MPTSRPTAATALLIVFPEGQDPAIYRVPVRLGGVAGGSSYAAVHVGELLPKMFDLYMAVGEAFWNPEASEELRQAHQAVRSIMHEVR